MNKNKTKMESKYEDMHKSDEEHLEEDKEYRESVCPNYHLDFGNADSFGIEDEEDIIKPSMITDIPKSVEEMLKNSDD